MWARRRLTMSGCAPSPMMSSLPSGCTHSGQELRRTMGIQMMPGALATSSFNLCADKRAKAAMSPSAHPTSTSIERKSKRLTAGLRCL